MITDAAILQGPSFGRIFANGDRIYRYRLNNRNAEMDPPEDGETLDNEFIYQATDANGHTDTATVSITINGVSDSEPALIADTRMADDFNFRSARRG